MEQDKQEFAINLITTLTKNLDDPTPEHKAAAEAMLAELDQRVKQLPPVDMDAYAAVCDRLEVLERLPDNLVTSRAQEAIILGNDYLDNPTVEKLKLFENVYTILNAQINFDLDIYGKVLKWGDLLAERKGEDFFLWSGAYGYCLMYLAAPIYSNYVEMYRFYKPIISSWSQTATTHETTNYDNSDIPDLPEPKAPEIINVEFEKKLLLNQLFKSAVTLLSFGAIRSSARLFGLSGFIHEQAKKDKDKE